MKIQPSAPRLLAITLALLAPGAARADEHVVQAVAARLAKPPAHLRVDAPLAEPLARGLVVVPFQTEHRKIVPLNGMAAFGVAPATAQLHVSVERALWHRVYTIDESMVFQPSRYNLNALRAEEPSMTTDRHQEVGADLYRRWASMWNGNLAIASDIIADGFVAHLTGDAITPLEDIRDAASVARWVASIRKRGSSLSYTVELGPIVDADLVVAYWRLVGMRQGPDGSSEHPFEKVGIDILRYRGHRLVECWTMNNNARK
jgi:hypothetical protein